MINLLGPLHDCYTVMSGLKGKPADWQLVQRRYSRCVANLSDRWIGIVCAWCNVMYCDDRGYRCDCYRPLDDRAHHVRHPEHDPLKELSV